jgi:predicted GIY-YIG superfamily endonuclease
METNSVKKQWYVYILKCSNNKIYTGCTHDLSERIQSHSRGEVISTKSYLPVEILTYICFSDKYLAFNFEKYLKSGSGRAFAKKHLYEIRPPKL